MGLVQDQSLNERPAQWPAGWSVVEEWIGSTEKSRRPEYRDFGFWHEPDIRTALSYV